MAFHGQGRDKEKINLEKSREGREVKKEKRQKKEVVWKPVPRFV